MLSNKKQLIQMFEDGQIKELSHDIEHLWDTYIVDFYDGHVFGYEDLAGLNNYFYVKVNGNTFRVGDTTYHINNFI